MRISILITFAVLFLSCVGDSTSQLPPEDDFQKYLDSLDGKVPEQVIDLEGGIEQDTPAVEEPGITYADGEVTFTPGNVKWSSAPKTFTVDLHLEIVEDTIYNFTIKTTGGSARKAAPSPGHTYHVVKKGETLSGLAAKYGVPVRCINGGKPLFVNTKIRIGCE